MNFFRALFAKKSTPHAESVRQYLASEIARLDRGELNFADTFSICVFGPIESFAARDGKPIVGLEPYVSDASLFELACYSLTSCDVWVFAHAEHARQRIMGLLISRFDKIFQNPLKLSDPDLACLVEDRMASYGRLFASGADAQTLHAAVSVAMHNTVQKGSVRIGATKSLPMVDAILDYSLKMALIDWDKRFLPQTVDALRKVAIAV